MVIGDFVALTEPFTGVGSSQYSINIQLFVLDSQVATLSISYGNIKLRKIVQLNSIHDLK